MLCKSINNNIKIWNKSCREENHSLSSYRTGFVEEVYRILSFQKVSQCEAVVKGQITISVSLRLREENCLVNDVRFTHRKVKYNCSFLNKSYLNINQNTCICPT